MYEYDYVCEDDFVNMFFLIKDNNHYYLNIVDAYEYGTFYDDEFDF